MSALALPIAAADTTVVAAFAVGFISFVSPCVLPLVPGYLSAVSGVSIADMQEGGIHARSRVIIPALIFCLSFTLMFVVLGMTATGLGSTLRDHKQTLDKVAGGMIIAMGVFFLLTPLVPKLNREWRPEQLIKRAGTGGPIVAGLAFAIAWTPCVGPTLASILSTAAISTSVAHGGILLAFYSLGLALPFLLTALAFDKATGAWRWLRDHYVAVTCISGAILIAMGIMILTGQITRLNIEAQHFLDRLGLDGIYKL